MYGKLFSQMYDGTLVGDWKALVTFQQMIVLCGSDGVIDMTPIAIANRTGIPVDVITDGIKILEAPDQYSRTPDNEGKRIERLDEHRDWGWSIVNHDKYRILKSQEEVREQNRLRKQKQREREDAQKEHNKNNEIEERDASVTKRDERDSHACHAKSRYADTNANTDTSKKHMSKSQAITDPLFGRVTKKITKTQSEKVVELYHEVLPELQKVTIKLFHNSARQKQLAARWAQDQDFRTEEFWRGYFQTVRASDHWMGDNDRAWKADFEFLMTARNFIRACEKGGYGQ